MKYIRAGSLLITLLIFLLTATVTITNASGGFGELNNKTFVSSNRVSEDGELSLTGGNTLEGSIVGALVKMEESIQDIARKKDHTLTSAIVAVLLGLAGIFKVDEIIKKRRFKPVLTVQMKPEPPDCLKIPMADSTGKRWDVYYYRFRVINNGNLQMEEVEVVAEELHKKDGQGQYAKINNFLPMNIVWEQTHLVTRPKIQPKLFKHCDFGHIRKTQDIDLTPFGISSNSNVVLILSTEVTPFNGSNILLPGTYKIKLIFAATNLEPAVKWYELTFLDMWDNNEQQMLNRALVVQETTAP